MITNPVFSEETAGMRAGLEKLFCKDHNSRIHEAERSPTHSVIHSCSQASIFRFAFHHSPCGTASVAPAFLCLQLQLPHQNPALLYYS
jgi:hypothetical protein